MYVIRNHPLPALLFMWAVDLAGILLAGRALLGMGAYTGAQWAELAVWTLLLCAASRGGIQFIDLKVHSGWIIAILFAMTLVLEYPLFCLAVLLWSFDQIWRRHREKHREPWVGPDFNAANVLLNAALALGTYELFLRQFEPWPIAASLALVASGGAFLGLQTLLLTILLALEQRKPWWSVGSLKPNALITDATMVAVGAVVARLYHAEPYLLGILLVPVLLLHRWLARLAARDLAYVDEKTGLYNFRHFDETLSKLFADSLHTRERIGLLFADMDFLREINNTHGHLVGDQVLVQTAALMKEAAGPAALVCRFGGEEFAIIAPGVDAAGLSHIAERVRKRVAEASIRIGGGPPLRVTISLGAALYPDDATTTDGLVKAADDALYAAKRSGRNRVCQYRQSC